MSSGNVVPAVGKGEGATPRRIQGLVITKSKDIYPISESESDIFHISSGHKMFQMGLCPFWLPYTGTSPVTQLNRLTARGTRGVTPVAGCTPRLPRLNGITKAD